MKLFTIHVGAASAFDAVLNVIYPRFDSFTILNGQGVFRGQSEPALLVHVATNDGLGVIAAAQAVRAALNQTGVGIEYDGLYYRCRENDDALELQQQLGREARWNGERHEDFSRHQLPSTR